MDARPHTSAELLREAMVAELRRNGALTRSDVERAMRRVPRHLFVPGSPLNDAYQDRAIMTKTVDGVPISSLSQPAIVTIMLEQLDVRPGMNVLEIGAGTGYNAGLLAELAGPTGRVATIDIDEDIVEAARAHLTAAGIEHVTVIQADGGHGLSSRAPYDRIMLAVAAWDISPAWLEQLKPGGLLVLPLWLGIRQFSVAFEKVGEHLESRSIRGCGFMPLRGAFAGPALFAATGGVQFAGSAVSRIDPAAVAALLESPPRHFCLPAQTAVMDLIDFMALSDQIVCAVHRAGRATPDGRAYVLVADEGRSAAWMKYGEACNWEPGVDVDVYGSDAAWHLLSEQLGRFEAAHSPSLTRAHVSARLPTSSAAQEGALTLRKSWMMYEVQFG